MSDEQTKKEGKLCRGEGGVKGKTKPFVLSVSECRAKESAVRQSPACTSQPTVSIPPAAPISQHSQTLSLTAL